MGSPSYHLWDSPDRELWVATGNRKKLVELERLLEPLSIRIRSLADAPRPVQIIEDAPTFAGNAAKKALALACAVGTPAIGDDSGLCVDALDGRPGVLSARYAGPDATDADRNHKLLGELADVPREQRSARFVCHVCLADSSGRAIADFEGRCEGHILTEPRGAHGFGYDPVFEPKARADGSPRVSPGQPISFAEFTPEQKDEISHRGAALRRLLTFLTSST